MRLGHLEIRALQALRAGGMTATEAIERWADGARSLNALCRKGLVTQIDELFVITEAGRAACPFRNPLAALPAQPAKQELSMSKETIVTRQQVLAAIVAAGSAGITRRALISRFNVGESCIDSHISLLNKALPPVIYKPEPGRCVAIEYKLAAPLNIEADDWIPEPLATDPPAVPPSPPAGEGPGEREATRYAIAFESDFHDNIESAVNRAVECYDDDSLKKAIVVTCTPVGRIAVRPVFVPEAA